MIPEGHRRLILTRHAKSSWDDPTLDDHERPLNPRGRAAAKELGEWLASRGYLPDQILCSTSRRTAETWDSVAAALPEAPEPEMSAALYHAGPDLMLKVLKGAVGASVMMLGHNPGIGEFAGMLPAERPHHPDFDRYPTAATLVVDFQIPAWGDVAPRLGSVLDFFVPSTRG